MATYISERNRRFCSLISVDYNNFGPYYFTLSNKKENFSVKSLHKAEHEFLKLLDHKIGYIQVSVDYNNFGPYYYSFLRSGLEKINYNSSYPSTRRTPDKSKTYKALH